MPARLHPCEAALDHLPAQVMVAVSGGVDSVAMLEALVRTGRKPIVLHVNHGWRAESRQEAKEVRDLARAHHLTFATATLRKAKRTEAAARSARYAFFAQMAKEHGVPDLVLAHHADDQVETFLLQLLRGAGAGARGMDPLSKRDGLILHRPWLAIWKREIIAYARACKLSWNDDSTNLDLRHRRNLFRHAVLPLLAQAAGPATAEHLWRAAEVARAEGEWLDALCSDLVGAPTLPVTRLRATPVAQQRRTILRWLQGRGIVDLTFIQVENVRALLHQRTPAKVNLARGRFARRRAQVLFVE